MSFEAPNRSVNEAGTPRIKSKLIRLKTNGAFSIVNNSFIVSCEDREYQDMLVIYAPRSAEAYFADIWTPELDNPGNPDEIIAISHKFEPGDYALGGTVGGFSFYFAGQERLGINVRLLSDRRIKYSMHARTEDPAALLSFVRQKRQTLR